MYGVNYFKYYLMGRKFTLITDHKPLQYLMTMKKDKDKLTRWALQLQQYDFTVEYRKGQDNTNADALSRYVPEITTLLKEIKIWEANEVLQDQEKCKELQPFLRLFSGVPVDKNTQLEAKEKNYSLNKDGWLVQQGPGKLTQRIVVPLHKDITFLKCVMMLNLQAILEKTKLKKE